MQTREQAYAQYKEDVANLNCLRFAQRSHKSRPIGGRHYCGPVNRRAWSTCVRWLSYMANQSDALAQIVAEIGMPPLYQTAGEACAYVYERALTVMSKPYDDVIGRSGPEGGRHSAHQHAWTLEQKVLVLAYLNRATAMMDTRADGYGWALEALAAELHVMLPPWERVS